MTDKTCRPISADARVQRAIRNLVAYLEEDEFEHWEVNPGRNHIWHAVRATRDWLNADHNKPE
jgi:hypothetical protein